MKIFKYFCKTTLILLFVICSSLIASVSVSAYSDYDLVSTGYTLKGMANAYCFEHQQRYYMYADEKWEVAKKGTLTSGTDEKGKLAHAFAYIAYWGQERGAKFCPDIGYSSDDYSTKNDRAAQGAMWRLSDAIVDKGFSNEFFGTNNVTAVSVNPNYGKALYEEAIADANNYSNGTAEYKYTVNYKVWVNKGKYAKAGQTIVEVSASREIVTPTVKLDFYKKDRSGNWLDNTSIDVIKYENCQTISGGNTIEGGINLPNSSKKDGKIGGTVTITPENNTGSLTVIIHEYPKDGYIGITDTYFKVDYNKSSGDVTKISQYAGRDENGDNKWITPNTDYFTITTGKPAKITITNDKAISVPVYKKDTQGNNLDGVKININVTGDCENYNENLESKSGGYFGNINIKPTKASGTVYVKITESEKDGFEKMPGEATLTINYNNGKITSKTVDDAHKQYFNLGGDIILKNAKKPSITIKKDFVNEYNTKISEDTSGDKVQFKITCSTDVTAKVDGEFCSGNATKTVSLGDDKEIKITEITGTGTITVTETKTVDGYILASTIEYKVSKNADGTYVITKQGPATLTELSSVYESTITNTKAAQKIVYLKKIDQEGNALSEIPFMLNVHLARVIMIDNTIYLDGSSNDYNESEFKIYLPGDAEGKTIAQLKADHTIVYDNNKDGQVDIARAITDSNGEIKIYVLEAYQMGDVDLDGDVDATDSRLVLSRAASYNDMTIEDNDISEKYNLLLLADINQDGYITSDEYSYKWRETSYSKPTSEDLATFSDARYCLRVAAKLTSIKYSMLEIDSKELENSLYQYEGVESTDKFYYIADKAIKIDSTVDETMADFVRKIAEFIKAIANKDTDAIASLGTALSNMAESSTDVVITHVNEPNPWPLNIIKVDEKGNPLGSDFKFTVNIDNADKIIVEKQYINPGYLDSGFVRKLQAGDKDYDAGKELYEFRGPKSYLKTDANGEIVIEKVYAKSVKSTITITENALPEGNKIYKKIDETMIIGKDILAGNVNLYSIKGNHARIDRRNLATPKILIIDPIDDLTINLNKIDGKLHLPGAKFEVVLKAGEENIKSWTGDEAPVTDGEGKITLTGIDINGYLNKEFTLTFDEKVPPEGYDLPDNTVSTIKFDYVKSNGFIIVEDSTGTAEFDGTDLTLNIPNQKKKIGLTLQKRDTFQDPVSGAKFEITTEGIKSFEYEGAKDGDLYVTSENGEIVFTKITPDDSKDTIKVTLNEKYAPNGLAIMEPNPITVVWNKDASGKYILAEQSGVTKGDDDSYAIVAAKDKAVIKQLTLQKSDKSTEEPLVNAEFTINFGGNVSKLKIHESCAIGASGSKDNQGYYTIVPDGESNITCKSNGDGKILLKDIEITSKRFTITMSETGAPDSTEYDYNIDPLKDIKFDITYNDYGKDSGGITVTKNAYKANGETELKFSDYVSYNMSDIVSMNANNYDLSLTWYNVPLMSLEGQVWLDEQVGNKAATPRDGVKNDGAYLPKVTVYLFEQNNGVLSLKDTKETQGTPDDAKLVSGRNVDYSSDADAGKYYFNGLAIPSGENGYVITFEYDGIEYEDTISGGNSTAFEYNDTDEFARNRFNDRFKEIKNEASLGYDYYRTGADLKYNINGENPVNSNRNFKVRANTGLYNKTNHNVDFGMVQRELDLSIYNDVQYVTYKINGKEWKESNTESSIEAPAKIIRSSSMYNSDYKYRFDDYISLANTDTSLAEGKDRIGREDSGDLKRSDILGKESELQVEVTNILKIKNNIPDKGINSVKVHYTYDNEKYELKSVDGNTRTDNPGSLDIDLTGRKITDGINIVFALKRDAEGNLPEEIASTSGLTITTTAEILSYTTEVGGYIDMDSEPGNGRTQEDDMQSCDITFTIKDEVREISGNVAEAKKEGDNYTQTLSDKNINDVIVQLIEIFKDDSDGKFYEYIWQETRTGSGTVKARGVDNTTYTYTVEKADGQYKFLGTEKNAKDSTGNARELNTGFIPGTYIVRFIYGDGTTYDLTDNVAKYNGQDYKSTIDKYYQEEYYNADKVGDEIRIRNPKTADNESTARDNPTRRTEVMAPTVESDRPLITALGIMNKEYNDIKNDSETMGLLKDFYNNTFIKDIVKTEINGVVIERSVATYINYITNNTTTIPNAITGTMSENEFKLLKNYVFYKTWMCADTSKIEVNGGESVKYNHVNFALAQRPSTNITTEKHLTALTITPTGNGATPVVDAKANVNKLLEDNIIETTGINNHLTTDLSTRDNRGFWKVETDIEELAQGATLEAEYTYILRNNSEEDYLSKTLVDVFNANPEKYSNVLKDYSQKIKDDYRKNGYYNSDSYAILGTYYYTGVKTSNDVQVTSRVDKIQETINKDLTFTEATTTDFKVAQTKASKKMYDTNRTLKDVELTVVENKDATKILSKGENDTRTIKLTTSLSASKPGITIPSYIAEVTKYSNAAGRRDTEAEPENLGYVHSEDTTLTLASKYEDGTSYNEHDEDWAETIVVSKPTGGDRSTIVQIAIIATISLAAIGTGIFLIKKYVLVK